MGKRTDFTKAEIQLLNKHKTKYPEFLLIQGYKLKYWERINHTLIILKFKLMMITAGVDA